ncbi:MAG: hypothetical protein ABEK16_05915 [Candidatus Nanohalobium sp.]
MQEHNYFREDSGVFPRLEDASDRELDQMDFDDIMRLAEQPLEEYVRYVECLGGVGEPVAYDKILVEWPDSRDAGTLSAEMTAMEYVGFLERHETGDKAFPEYTLSEEGRDWVKEQTGLSFENDLGQLPDKYLLNTSRSLPSAD